MSTRHCLLPLSACVVCLVLGCNDSNAPQPLSIVLQGDPAAKAQVEAILKENRKRPR